MANIKITDLTAATALGGTELFECVQSAASVKASATQIKTFVGNSDGGKLWKAVGYRLQATGSLGV